MAEAGEVEPEDCDTRRREALGDAACGLDVLPAGEAVREERRGQRRVVGQVKARGERVAGVTGEGEAFGGHGGSGSGARRLCRNGGSGKEMCRRAQARETA